MGRRDRFSTDRPVVRRDRLEAYPTLRQGDFAVGARARSPEALLSRPEGSSPLGRRMTGTSTYKAWAKLAPFWGLES
jgi:hypothetical protein